jgi:protein-disulfide isomerase
MKRLSLTIFLLTLAGAASAADVATIRAYATKALTQCPDSVVTVTQMQEGPAGFAIYQVKQTSSDQYCGTQKWLLHSPKSDQVLLGTVIPLPPDSRPLNVRIAEKTSELLRKPHNATVSPFPLPDGVRPVSISRQTDHGSFSYHGFVDSSGLYLIVGSRGTLQTPPAKTLREQIGLANAVRRGNKDAKIEIIELSDFECPSCARAHKSLEPLIAKNLSRINYYRLDLPLFEQHMWSVDAAAAARAFQKVAPKQYWEYVDYVFKNQEEIGKMKFDAFIRDYVQDHDVDWAAFEKVYRSKVERQAILDQVSRSFDLGVASTPTFIINGQMVGYGPEGKMVNEILAAALKTTGSAKAPAKPAAKKK